MIRSIPILITLLISLGSSLSWSAPTFIPELRPVTVQAGTAAGLTDSEIKAFNREVDLINAINESAGMAAARKVQTNGAAGGQYFSYFQKSWQSLAKKLSPDAASGALKIMYPREKGK